MNGDSSRMCYTKLTKVDKFTYLLNSLLGTAVNTIRGLYLTEENYMTTVRCLQE